MIFRDEKKFLGLMSLSKDPLLLPPHHIRHAYKERFIERSSEALNVMRSCQQLSEEYEESGEMWRRSIDMG
jgi:hypothetical protein